MSKRKASDSDLDDFEGPYTNTTASKPNTKLKGSLSEHKAGSVKLGRERPGKENLINETTKIRTNTKETGKGNRKKAGVKHKAVEVVKAAPKRGRPKKEEEEKSESEKDDERDEDFADEKEPKKRRKNEKPTQPKKKPRKATVVPTKPLRTKKRNLEKKDKSEEGEDWEDVQWEDGEAGEPEIKVEAKDGVINVVVEKELVAEEEAKKKPALKRTSSGSRETKERKELRLNYQTAFLLTLFAHGKILNKLCDENILQGLLISIIPEAHGVGSREKLEKFLESLLTWWSSEFTEIAEDSSKVIDVSTYTKKLPPRAQLISAVKDKKGSKLHNILLFLAALRGLDFFARLVWKLPSTLPVPKAKPSDNKSETQESPPKKRKLEAREAANESMFEHVWIEVYSTHDERWLALDITKKPIICDNAIDIFAPLNGTPKTGRRTPNKNSNTTFGTSPFVMAYEGEIVVDVSASRKEHEDIFTKTLPNVCPKNYQELERITKDFESLEAVKNSEPPPTSFTPYKSHHLYCMKQFIGKFQVIHPPDTKPVLTLKGQEVFLRKDVYDVHTSERWLQFGKQVKEGEEPVKELPKRKRPPMKRKRSGLSFSASVELEVDEEVAGDDSNPDGKPTEMSGYYGPWQVEDYKPGGLVDGKVPTNRYGNVYLFTANMLPEGCKHLDMDNVMAVGRKLGVSVAPAMVGWHHGCRGSRPVLEGAIVPADKYKILRDACKEDVKSKLKRELEKRRLKAEENWKLMYRKISEKNTPKETPKKAEPKKKKPKNEVPAGFILRDSDSDFEKPEKKPSKITPKTKKVSKPDPKSSKKTQHEQRSASMSAHVHVFDIISEDKTTGMTKKSCCCGFSMLTEQL